MSRKQQQGMTMWGTMFVVGVAVFFVFLLFKLLPPYLSDMKVRTAMEGLAQEASTETLTKGELINRLSKRFDIDDVTSVQAGQLKIQAQGRNKVMRLSYEVVVPMAFNISALLEFNHEQPVNAAE